MGSNILAIIVLSYGTFVNTCSMYPNTHLLLLNAWCMSIASEKRTCIYGNFMFGLNGAIIMNANMSAWMKTTPSRNIIYLAIFI